MDVNYRTAIHAAGSDHRSGRVSRKPEQQVARKESIPNLLLVMGCLSQGNTRQCVVALELPEFAALLAQS